MKVNDTTNLYVGYNNVEDFRILICATDNEKANLIAEEYLKDSGMEGSFFIDSSYNKNLRFDCDYILF